MSRYINADELLNEFHRYAWDTEDLHIDLIEDIVNDEPTADVRENVKGQWIFPYGDKKYKRCSVCGRVFYSIPYNTNFCPSCGADMRGE